MTPVVIGLVLCAAALHASWNAMLRSRADRLWSITVMSFATTAVALPFAILLPLPAPASWPYLCVSSALQVAYCVFLVVAYRSAELGQVYPIIRGCVPLLVTLGAAIFAGDHLGLLSVTGIVVVSLGIMSLALGKNSGGLISIAAAVATGVIIAGYTVTDGIGARLAGDSSAYTAWIFVLYGVLMPITFLLIRGKLTINFASPEARIAALAGMVQILTYAVVIWAFTLSPIGPVSALRETSVVFAALIGRIFLSETLTSWRLTACAAIAFGAFFLSYHP